MAAADDGKMYAYPWNICKWIGLQLLFKDACTVQEMDRRTAVDLRKVTSMVPCVCCGAGMLVPDSTLTGVVVRHSASAHENTRICTVARRFRSCGSLWLPWRLGDATFVRKLSLPNALTCSNAGDLRCRNARVQ